MHYGEDVQKILQIAAEKARGLGHSYIGNAHVLLALIQADGIVGQLLRGVGLEEEVVWCMTVVLYGRGTPYLPLPQGFSDQVRRMLRDASREAKQAGAKEVKQVHILLAILRQEKSAAIDVLTLSGVDTQFLFTRTVDYLHMEGNQFTKRKR